MPFIDITKKQDDSNSSSKPNTTLPPLPDLSNKPSDPVQTNEQSITIPVTPIAEVTMQPQTTMNLPQTNTIQDGVEDSIDLVANQSNNMQQNLSVQNIQPEIVLQQNSEVQFQANPIPEVQQVQMPEINENPNAVDEKQEDVAKLQVKFRDADEPSGYRYEEVKLPENVDVNVDDKGIKIFEHKKPEVTDVNNIEVQAVQTQTIEEKIQNSPLQDLSKQIDETTTNNIKVIEKAPEQIKFDGNVMSLDAILRSAIQQNASDIHLTVGYKPMLRVDGDLKTLTADILTDENLEQYYKELIKDKANMVLEGKSHLDFSYPYSDRRFRVNIFKSMGHIAAVLRMIPSKIKSVEELEIPSIVKEFANLANGLVLVTGPTGSGKSTTLAALLNHINTTQTRHIVTLEDPVEFVFSKETALVDQREFGQDFDNWENALKGLLRQDPDVVLVGEMRDAATMASTITIAETGHLVFATLHTNSAAQSIDRILDSFPGEQQSQIRSQLANVIAAVVSQRLVPLKQGGRKAALEIMIATPGLKNTIREGKTHQIDNMINTGKDIGMISLEKSLAMLVKNQLVDLEVAKTFTNKQEELELLLRS